MSPFREPTESEAAMDEMIERDRERYLLRLLRESLDCMAGDCDDHVIQLRSEIRAVIAETEGR